MVVFYRGLSDGLSLYVKQLAWLNATPESKGGQSETRLEAMKRVDVAPLLPPNPAPYLTEWLFDAGPSSPAGMGDAVLGWCDLQAWQSITGVELRPWEARTLRRLSRDYLNQLYEAKKLGCPAPYDEAERQARSRDKVADQFKAMVGAMRKG